MGIANLSGALAKIWRAQEHLNAMEREIDTFSSDNANAARITFRRKRRWDVAYVDPIPEVPAQVLLIVGDALNNIRAALDHLVWQLVIREDEEPQKANCFPIYTNCKAFTKDVEKALAGGRPSPLRGLPIDGQAWAFIKQAQSYCSSKPQDHPLALLDQLVNIDKHRTLLAPLVWTDGQTLWNNFRWRAEVEPISKRAYTTPLSSKDPTEVVRIRFPLGVIPGMYVEGKLRVIPSVGDGKTDPMPLTYLHHILLHVKKLVEEFAALPRVEP